MPNCSCGELCFGCGFDSQCKIINIDTRKDRIDRWQATYMNNVIGLDSLTSPIDEKQRPISLLQTMDKSTSLSFNTDTTPEIFSRRLENRRSMMPKSFTNSLFSSGWPPTSKIDPDDTNCGKCYKKLVGKTVRLPDSQIKYHYQCLTCNECNQPFKDTYLFIDSSKSIYHPTCAPSNSIIQTCFKCTEPIIGSYILLNSSTLHPKCFKCDGCQKVLTPSSIYINMNGSYCQSCANEDLASSNKEALTKHMKIVPQLQQNFITASHVNKLDTCTYHPRESNYCNSNPSTENASISSVKFTTNSELSISNLPSIKPSSLMSTRGRPLPRFGVIRECAGCSQRIQSVHEEIPGPKALKWHKKCLVCKGCNKVLDSGATVHKDEKSSALIPWCTGCLVSIIYICICILN
ncbi:uncharacterized protein BX663DRAFT_501843 [Cokeromyces recurvatus]|uniref:uncharacterized protein n=1 Tax=Cokeromyces recurvatus TaxID=90255 RepID=UPI00221FD9CC|nr:uncharacterized protein BX663DRAFT_501843 [Cokeromyces recurvatus]KAI7905124.1 hypothetical protein BX663DRAFT_501843 [Cokeromyces recurvatus]